MKRQLLTKILAVFICATTLFSLLAGAISAYAVGDIADTRATVRSKVSPYETSSGETVDNISGHIGVRLNINVPFLGFQIKLATYLQNDVEADMSIYKWEGSYAKSVAKSPVATKKVTLVDNNYAGITLDEELPAGDYLLLSHNFTKSTALYYYTAVSGFTGYVYRDGYPMTQNITFPNVQVLFSKRATTYFTQASKPEDMIDGSYGAPDEYVIPSNSLIYTHEVMPDTWVFTDGLGRASLTNEDVGNPRDKTLAIFYWTWHIDNQITANPVNMQELSEKYPSAMRDYDNPLWANYKNSAFMWNESIYGFYRSDDTWVLRKQAELLTNAGVDVIFTDNTNGQFTWKNAYTPLMEAWSQAMEEGLKTPKVSFMLPFGNKTDTNAQVKSIYLDIFRTGRYQSLWFYWDSKPMLMAMSDSFDASASPEEQEILNFFTFRSGQAAYVVSDTAHSSWGWLSMYPQALYYKNASDRMRHNVEQITVGVAMNHNYALNLIAPMNGDNIAGRSYTSTYQNRYEIEGSEASKWGYNFAEQFNYALSKNPQVIFVTGWNEFTAGRHEFWPEGYMSGVENAFPDQYNDEFSRDIEPTKGALQDHYYYQLVNFSRQYQGARPIPAPSENKSINLLGNIDQWNDVEPYYASYIGNTDDRNSKGYGSLYYTETSGRNDIIGSQIARDDDYIYFLVECANDITPYTDSLWMNLYIDSDQDNQGWNTFEYVLNKTQGSATNLVLEKFTKDNSYDLEKVASVNYKVDGRYMTVMIKKSDLGISGDNFTINFSWTDNVHDEGDYEKFSGDIMDFYISGDVAPGGRFKYSYISTTENSGNKPTDPENPDIPESSEETTSIITEDTSIITEDTSNIESDTEDAPTTDVPSATDSETDEITPDVTEGAGDNTNTDADSTEAEINPDVDESDSAQESQSKDSQNQSSGKKGCGSVVVASPITIIAIGAYLTVRRKGREIW